MKSEDKLKIRHDVKELNIIGLNKSNNNDINTIDMTTDTLNNLDSFNNYENSSRMQEILDEFTKLYTNKISRINEAEEKDEEWMKKKTTILESWVEDLGEQNSVLVSTVQQLENEAKHRVTLLQEKLEKMALVTKESCVSLRDHQIQVDTLVAQKIKAEDHVQMLREKIISLEETNSSLLLENSDLKYDLESLIEVITIVRTSGRLDLNRMKFKQIVPANLFGSDFSLSLKDFVQRHSADGCKSSKLSMSSLGSGSTDTEEESSGKQHRMAEFKSLRKNYKEANALLVERDKHIADLQSQITELHHQLAVAQTEVDNTTSILDSLRDRGRYDTMEICRRDDMIRHLLTPKHSDYQNLTNQTDTDLDTCKKTDLEMQLSNNIDVLASKLSDLEEECRQLRHQNDVLKTAHSHCSPIIGQFQEQLGHSNKTIKDLRIVLTEEVAERHSQILSLRNQLLKTSELHKDALNELQNKNELVQQLKQEIISEQTEKMNLSSIELSCHSTQTDKMENTSEPTEVSSSDDRLLSINIKISKLENELSEKHILLRELQTHLASSRKELNLKDETLYNIEQKLNLTRRDCDEKEERMNYLTSQLTSLQLEVSRLHGTVQLLRHQLESKSNLVKKLESENESLCWQLNDKSSTLEKLQKEISSFQFEIENRKKEIREQKLTIGTLQDALVSTKQTCDKFRKHFDFESDSKYTSKCSLQSSTPLTTTTDGHSTSSIRRNNCKDPACSSSFVPDIRPTNSNAPPLKQDCPDVVSFLNGRKTLDLSSPNSLTSATCFNSSSAQSIIGGSMLIEADSGPKSLLFLQGDSSSLVNVNSYEPPKKKFNSNSNMPNNVEEKNKSSNITDFTQRKTAIHNSNFGKIFDV